ncbi:MAG: hypothetical protein EA358_01910 [Flavobacteriales bacterium]|nr:MAG: hypothetical protein EA358_01910 [Flavobacteriales bacterium]
MNPSRLFELSAVVSSLFYTYLIGIGSVYCWGFALYSGLVFTYLCFSKRIYAEAFLHVFYFVIGIYGWLNWGENSSNGFSTSLPWDIHILAIIGLSVISFWIAKLLGRFSDAKMVYLDSFTTVFSIWATVLMVQLIVDNWIYFLFINAAAFFLYFSRKLYFTAALMIVYVALSIKGYQEWLTL